MSSTAVPTLGAPTHVYFHNPLLLLTSNPYIQPFSNSEGTETDISKHDTLETDKIHKTGDSANGRAKSSSFSILPSPDANPYFSSGSIAEEYVNDISKLISANITPRPDPSPSLPSLPSGSTPNQTEHSNTPTKDDINNEKTVNPFQILYSNLFKCYTSLAFYAALLSHLKKWIPKIDNLNKKHRKIVWDHLFCIIDAEQSSSDPFGPLLHSIASQPKMDLLDIEILYLSFLLSLRIYPSLLSSQNIGLDSSEKPSAATETAMETQPIDTNPESSDLVATQLVEKNLMEFFSNFRYFCAQRSQALLSIYAQHRSGQLAALAMVGTPAFSMPVQQEVNHLFSMKQLFLLKQWAQKLEALDNNTKSMVWEALQNVPALKALVNEARAGRLPSFTKLISDCDASPQQNLMSISALYNTIMMLKSVGHLNEKDFEIDAKLVTEKLHSVFQTPPVVPTVSIVSPHVSWPNTIPAWSPVPSPLTTVSSALKFAGHSPLTSVSSIVVPTGIRSRPGSVNSGVPGSPIVHFEPTFAKSVPKGAHTPAVAPGQTLAPSNEPLPVFQGLISHLESKDRRSSFTSAFKNSAFSSLKRAAEAEAEGASPSKKSKTHDN